MFTLPKRDAPSHPASPFEAYWSDGFPKVEGWVDARLAPWAVHHFYGRTVPRIKPFLYACHKLFFVGYGWHAAYFKAFAEQAHDRSDMRISPYFGSQVVAIYP
jgi:hypothetical protein